jgi:hypothetical protein
MTDLQNTIPTSEREAARKRIQDRRNLQGGLLAYVVFNVCFVLVWAMTGRGYFWPGWIIAGWGAGMVMAVWGYSRGAVTEDDVEHELHRMR